MQVSPTKTPKMKINSISIKLFFGLILPLLGWSQGEEKDNLGTQQVTVTKSYSPSLSNVFKIRSKPEVNDSLSKKKLGVNYTFLSLPVISTFVPNKASPLKLQKQEATFFYNSYVSGGLGNKSSFLLDAAMMLPLDRSQGLGFDFRRSAVSGVEGTLLPSDQSRTTLNLLHQYKTKSLNVNSDFRFDRQNHNFYGISEGDRTNFDSSVSDNIDSKQNLNYLSIRSKWQWYESPFSKLYFNTSITTDYFDTTENILKINTQLRLPLFGQYLEVTPGFQLVNTDFKTAYYSDKSLSFQEGLTDLELQFLNIGKKFKFRVGAHAFYVFGYDSEKSAVFVTDDYLCTAASYINNEAMILGDWKRGDHPRIDQCCFLHTADRRDFNSDTTRCLNKILSIIRHTKSISTQSPVLLYRILIHQSLELLQTV